MPSTQGVQATSTLPNSVGLARAQRLRLCWFAVAIALAGLRAWAAGHNNLYGTDGISNLEVGEAFFRGDWRLAMNGMWSPLYPVLFAGTVRLLHAGPWWEFVVQHWLNFAIFVAALFAFDRFWRQLTSWLQDRGVSFDARTCPTWAWTTLGYVLFLWATLEMIGIEDNDPDLSLAMIIYLLAALLLRMERGRASVATYLQFGLLLGLGYLTKAVMFPLAFVFLGAAFWARARFGGALRRVSLSLVIFAVVAAPFIASLSFQLGRLTFSESGRLNYALHVNGVPMFWVPDVAANGKTARPLTTIFTGPPVYAYPVKGDLTSLFADNPPLFYQGLNTEFHLVRQLRVLATHARWFLDQFAVRAGAVLVSFLVLCFAAGSFPWSALRKFAILLLPSLVAMFLYALVHCEARYIAPFFVLLWAPLFATLLLSPRRLPPRVFPAAVLAIAIGLAIPFAISTVTSVRLNAFDTEQWRVARGLRQMGVVPGESVAAVADWNGWARMARVHIAAEIPEQDYDRFWRTAPAVQAQMLDAMAQAGAKAVVGRPAPSAAPRDWQRIGDTSFFAYIFARP